MRGKLYVISGPSGAGLKDIVSRVIESRDDIGAVVPVTARKMMETMAELGILGDIPESNQISLFDLV